jgi:hypothetical protein
MWWRLKFGGWVDGLDVQTRERVCLTRKEGE